MNSYNGEPKTVPNAESSSAACYIEDIVDSECLEILETTELVADRECPAILGAPEQVVDGEYREIFETAELPSISLIDSPGCLADCTCNCKNEIAKVLKTVKSCAAKQLVAFSRVMSHIQVDVQKDIKCFPVCVELQLIDFEAKMQRDEGFRLQMVTYFSYNI